MDHRADCLDEDSTAPRLIGSIQRATAGSIRPLKLSVFFGVMSKRHIAHLTPTYFGEDSVMGGGDRYVYYLAKALDTIGGFDQCVFALGSEDLFFEHDGVFVRVLCSESAGVQRIPSLARCGTNWPDSISPTSINRSAPTPLRSHGLGHSARRHRPRWRRQRSDAERRRARALERHDIHFALRTRPDRGILQRPAQHSDGSGRHRSIHAKWRGA
jgi:hypothetical protein